MTRKRTQHQRLKSYTVDNDHFSQTDQNTVNRRVVVIHPAKKSKEFTSHNDDAARLEELCHNKTGEEHGETAEIFITDSSLKFLRPVRGEIATECARPDPAVTARFIDSYRQRGKARWSIEVVIRAGGEPAMTFTGQYVIYRPESA